MKAKREQVFLTYVRVVRVDRNVRSRKDGRKRVDAHIVAYKDERGNEYRKRFETKPGGGLVINSTIEVSAVTGY